MRLMGGIKNAREDNIMNYLITGATGYIGSALTKYILNGNKTDRVLALVRSGSVNKAEQMLPAQTHIIGADLSDRKEVLSVCRQLNETGVQQIDYILHCASITKSSEMREHPVEVIESIVNTTQNMMELARQTQARSVVVLSSMEVYGDIDCSDGHRVTEDEVSYGKVELLNIRSCYPLGKRMVENICYCYYKEYGVPVKIARLAQTFGTGVLPSDNRVFAQFSRAAVSGENIVLHTAGNSMGNYCGIEDAVRGILTILQKGKNGEAYNVVNEANTMSIRQMAELVCEKIADGHIQAEFDIPEDNTFGYAADTGLRLSGQKLKDLGWEPEKLLEDMYWDMVKNK